MSMLGLREDKISRGGLRNLHEGWDPERHYVVGHTNPEILGITEYLILY